MQPIFIRLNELYGKIANNEDSLIINVVESTAYLLSAWAGHDRCNIMTLLFWYIEDKSVRLCNIPRKTLL